MFLTASQPSPVTAARSLRVIKPRRSAMNIWSRWVCGAYAGAKGGRPRTVCCSPGTGIGTPRSPETPASGRWARLAVPGSAGLCGCLGSSASADRPVVPVCTTERNGCSLRHIPSANTRILRGRQTHDTTDFDSCLMPQNPHARRKFSGSSKNP